MVFQYLYFWQVGKINELKDRDKYYISAASYLLLLSCYLCLFAGSAIAQIIPDGSLGAESSRIVPDNINNLPSDRITGGATRGSNLFHSFREFNVGEGRGAYFANLNGIANIFTRVTGGNPSNILGVLGVQGNANLFLINPRGIIFGPNARLDLGGSFIGSTADSIVFNNSFEFSAANPNAVPLLAINIPVGLRFRDNPGAIVNTSRVTQVIEGTEIPVGLAVPPGQTLALVGGDLTFDNGFASAFSGNIQLGSVASPGLVSFKITPTGLGLDYTNIPNFGKIELSGLSAVTASGLGGGAIALQAGNVILRDRAGLISDTLGDIDSRDITIQSTQLQFYDKAFIETATLATGNAGNISIIASESAQLTGSGFAIFVRNALEDPIAGRPNPFPRESSIFSSTIGAGKAGNITIDTPQLTLREGMFIGTPTFGPGTGGNLTVRASESVELVGSGLYSTVTNQGNGGNINIDTQRLSIREGAVVTTATAGQGRGGDIIVKASDSVLISENRPDSPIATTISTNTFNSTGNAGNRTGDAGNIEINTRSFLAEAGVSISSTSGLTTKAGVFSSDGARGGNITINATDSVRLITTTTSDSAASLVDVLARESNERTFIVAGVIATGVGGELTINTRQLVVEGGSGIGTSTLGSGAGGNISINASESVELKGTTSSGRFAGGIASGSGDLLLQTLYQLPSPRGAAGNLSITTPRLIVRDGATVSVGSLGTGRAGNINVVANSIALDTKGSIDGTTASGTGANINIKAQDIQLRRGSRITTDAGSSDGGNININSSILAALPKENSDITANARSAAGGRVNINVPNVFGFRAVTRQQLRGTLGLTDAQFAALQVSPTSLLSTSDIAAISQNAGPALQGTVTFSTSGVNPAQGLVELPQNLVNPAALIAVNPCIEVTENEFTITGRGGVPPSPNDALSSAPPPFPWVEEKEGSSATDSGTDLTDRGLRAFGIRQEEVVPARSWVVNAQGEVTLVGYNLGNAADSRHPRQNSVCAPR